MARLSKIELKQYLDEKAAQYESAEFLETDPLGVVHRAESKQDKEILGLLTALIAWGNRKSIINNAEKIFEILEDQPYHFLLEHTSNEIERATKGFVHRTFNDRDLAFLLIRLKDYYSANDSLESLFQTDAPVLNSGISNFRNFILGAPHESRFEKHLADPSKGSAAKRIHLYLRWMVRSNQKGVDFGIWNKIDTGQLSCPLDVHTARIAKQLGLLKRRQNDAKALEDLDSNLRAFDPFDPVKYDFALFGIGAFEQF
jgi:uncharacterized protein (TIGR02757 family)